MGPYIQPKNQDRKLMEESVQFIRHQIPPGSFLFTDNGGGLSLSYYLCAKRIVVQDEEPFSAFSSVQLQRAIKWITPAPIFEAGPDRARLKSIESYVRATPGVQMWFFQAGWIVDKEHDFQALAQQIGCRDSRKFGRNILLCQL